MTSRTNSGMIVWDDEFGITYSICRLDHTVYDDGNYEYVFTPNYRVMDMLPMNSIGGIPGLDLDLRLERYVRRNMEPVFMTERSPSRNRADVWDLMDEVKLDRYDRLEWLIRTDMRYAGDDLYVIRYECPKEFEFDSPRKEDAARSCTKILAALATGGKVTVSGIVLDADSAVSLGHSLRLVLQSDKMANPERTYITSAGRKKKRLDESTLYWAHEKMSKSQMTSEEVADHLHVSRSTLYRRLKELGY